MADSAVSNAPTAVPAQASPKKAKSAASSGSKKPRLKPSHPRTSEMVSGAIKSLKERGGSSLQAIKKYIASNYKVDPEKLAPFIKKYLKAAVASGELVQTKGKGASGSFKLASAAKPESSSAPSRGGKSKEKKQKSTKRSAPKSPKKAAAKKPTGGEKRKAAPAPKPKKSPSKAKRASKVPTKKPKAPKPKKVAKAKAPKKASPKKK